MNQIVPSHIIQKMRVLISILNDACKAYYQKDKEIMSNYEYDEKYQELENLEKQYNCILSNSPTQRVGYPVLSALKKIEHKTKMLSLKKDKNIQKVIDFVDDKIAMLSWKLDGLTITLTYDNGVLLHGVTRGDGLVGEDVSHNVKVMSNVPLTIPVKHRVVVRGEAVLSYTDFEKINEEITDISKKYENPRNLASGSVRQLDSQKCAERNVQWIGFQAIEGFDAYPTVSERLLLLNNWGFSTVPFHIVNKVNIQRIINEFTEKVSLYDIPVDGLVVTYNNVEYGKSLGETSHHPRHSFVLKWPDKTKNTILRDIIVDVGKHGQISYTAIFDPIRLEGTTVTNATLHNPNHIMKVLKIGIGDEISVYKSNMVIPTIAKSITKSGTYIPSKICPFCGTILKEKIDEKGIGLYFCTNYTCPRRTIRRLTNWCSKDAMNLTGISEKTIKILYNKLNVKSLLDLYSLDSRKKELYTLEGFGEQKINNMLKTLEDSKKQPLSRVLYGLCIPNVGREASKILADHYITMNALLWGWDKKTLLKLVGTAVTQSLENTLLQSGSNTAIELCQLKGIGFKMTQPKQTQFTSGPLTGKTFVVTGKVTHFTNRDEIKAKITELGGNNGSSVTTKTDFLINNDIESTSGKNKKAIELGIPIISEDMFLSMYQS